MVNKNLGSVKSKRFLHVCFCKRTTNNYLTVTGTRTQRNTHNLTTENNHVTINKEIKFPSTFVHSITRGGLKVAQFAISSGTPSERKIISVSTKRQITIPQKYFDALGFGNEAECVLQGECIMLRPIQDRGGGAFSEQILSDLISQGFEGDELLEKFKQESKKIRPAVEKMIADTDAFVKKGGGKTSLDELFGTGG